jgi:hypothetical protein
VDFIGDKGVKLNSPVGSSQSQKWNELQQAFMRKTHTLHPQQCVHLLVLENEFLVFMATFQMEIFPLKNWIPHLSQNMRPHSYLKCLKVRQWPPPKPLLLK